MESTRKTSAKKELMDTLEQLLHKNRSRKYPSMNYASVPLSATLPFTRILKISTIFSPAAWNPRQKR